MHKLMIVGLAGCAMWSMVAQAAAPADTIASRQQNFKQIGKANKAITEELKGSSPSVALIQTNARTIASLSGKVATWFPAGTGAEAGVKTAALPAIWQNAATFKKAAAAFDGAARQLVAVSAGGNLAQIAPAAANVANSCKACHKDFRAKD